MTESPVRIYAFSPSSAIDADAFERGCRHLETAGLPVVRDRTVLQQHQRFAGRDSQRLAAFARAAASDCEVVMATRGGYGLTRILPELDWATLAAADKQWVGLSDFTAFHLGLLAQTGATSWAGPCLVHTFGVEDPAQIDETTEATFRDAVEGRLEVLGFRCQGAPKGLEIEDAVLWGGNLAMVCSLLGTPYFPQVDGGILFLEDVHEHPYRIERMLTQLHLAGVLDRQRAILLGDFTRWKAAPHDRGFDLEGVWKWLRGRTTTPVITGLPFGHEPLVLTLPHGAHVQLAVEGRTCYLVLPHSHDPDHGDDDGHDHGHDHGHHHAPDEGPG